MSKPIFTILKDWQFIILFALLKFLVHLITYNNFELHRDAYLYYAQSEHLAWGYVAVPPFIAVIGKLATWLFGNTTFALRFFPALIGAVNLVIIGLAVKEVGGKRTAIILASLAYLLSPAYLHTNALFQPVSFNHFFWLLASYLILVMINRQDSKYWLWIAVAFGVGFLNKYSIIFFCAAFAISLLISRHRDLYWSKYFLLAIVIGLVIILPNLLWQYQHNWPVVQHMTELRETQLVHVRLSDYLISQLMMNAHALIVWIGALLILLFYKKENRFQLFGLMYLIIVLIIMLGSGKAYYTLGIYPILFVFGAYFIEKYIKKYLAYVSATLVVFMLAALYISLSIDGIPFTTFEKAYNENAYRWEDGVNHDIPQDMADMTGWKEIGQSVNQIYIDLDEENRENCDIYCYHYGQAGSVMFYGKQINIPQPISFNGSFVFWAPDSLTKDYMIWIHSDLGNDIKPDSLLPQLFQKVELKETVDNQFFRENGTRIYLCESPSNNYKIYYKMRIAALKEMYVRK